jgi:ubiquinone/menaquinone biosynthesis C-methylase UbiE
VYKEMRTFGSSGEAWAAPFLAADSSLLDRVKSLSLHLDPRWRAIRRHTPRGSLVLDAGCGMGVWPAFLSGRGYRTIGIDFSDQMVALLRRRYPALDWRCARIQELPLEDASVDALISWGVIEHDERGPQAALAEFMRVMKPGGIAYLTVPLDSPTQRRSSRAQFEEAGADTFFQYFLTIPDFRGQVEAAGFRLVGDIVPVSRHHALAYPNLYVRLAGVPPLVQRAAGWALKPTLPFRSGSINMVLALARKP